MASKSETTITLDGTETLVMTDEGTHGGPNTVRVYRRKDGKHVTYRYHGGACVGCDLTDGRPTRIPTAGRIRVLAR